MLGTRSTTELQMFVVFILIAAMVGVGIAVLFDSLTPFVGPDLSGIQWPVPVDPTITIERRSS